MNRNDDSADKLKQRVRDWVLSQGLIMRGDRVLCALSGGADSVAMLLILSSLKQELGFEMHAVHVNHLLRGCESERDAVFCESLCLRRNIPFSLLKGDAALLKSEKKLGLEEAAREIRYGLLREEKIRTGCNKIATAHNSGDNLETVLINIIRGAALKGISGITPINSDIIRPVLPLSKGDNEKIVGYYDESFVVDSSNETDFCRRNIIRHHVLPILSGFNPAMEEMVLENGIILRGEEEHMKNASENALKQLENDGKLPLKHLLKLDKALLFRVLRLAAQKAGAQLDRKKTFEIVSQLNRGRAVWRLDVGEGVICERRYDGLMFKKNYGESVQYGEISDYRIALRAGTDALLPGGYRVIVKKTDKNTPADMENPENIYKLFNIFRINCDNINGDLTIRNPRKEDSLRRNAKSGSKRLSRLFIDAKIPREERNFIPVIADGRGILWAYGVGLNADFPEYRPEADGLSVFVRKGKTDYRRKKYTKSAEG